MNSDPDLLLMHVVTRAPEEEVVAAPADGTTQPEVIKAERKEKDKE